MWFWPMCYSLFFIYIETYYLLWNPKEPVSKSKHWRWQNPVLSDFERWVFKPFFSSISKLKIVTCKQPRTCVSTAMFDIFFKKKRIIILRFFLSQKKKEEDNNSFNYLFSHNRRENSKFTSNKWIITFFLSDSKLNPVNHFRMLSSCHVDWKFVGENCWFCIIGQWSMVNYNYPFPLNFVILLFNHLCNIMIFMTLFI